VRKQRVGVLALAIVAAFVGFLTSWPLHAASARTRRPVHPRKKAHRHRHRHRARRRAHVSASATHLMWDDEFDGPAGERPDSGN
jgi:hypothetical protein